MNTTAEQATCPRFVTFVIDRRSWLVTEMLPGQYRPPINEEREFFAAITDTLKLGGAFAAMLSEPAKDAIRSYYARKFGVCRRCQAPLGGASPEQICEPCHADEALEAAGGGAPTGEA